MLDLGRTFLQSVERSPHALAVVDGAQRLTYAEWYDRIQRVAAGLSVLGIGQGDHLMVVLQNRIEMATLHWACQFLGAIVTPLNWRAKPDEIDYCAGDANARAIVFQDVSADAVAESTVAQALPRIAVGGASGGTVAFETLLEASAQPGKPCVVRIDDQGIRFLEEAGGRKLEQLRDHLVEPAPWDGDPRPKELAQRNALFNFSKNRSSGR